MKKIKLGITGYSGKMGQAILAEVKNFPDFIISAGLMENKKDETQGSVTITDDLNEFCQLSDIIIDFSSPSLLPDLVAAVIRHKLPLICGTTGLGPAHFKALEAASKVVPVFYSQNMSIGIAVMCSLIREAYLKLADRSDIEVVETHHRNKKDAPSGTAILLVSQMLNKKNIEPDIIKRNLFEISSRIEGKIGISSVRGGTVPGQHDISFMMENENITVSHQALNRNIFAIGSLKAASWLVQQKAGLYSMKDAF